MSIEMGNRTHPRVGIEYRIPKPSSLPYRLRQKVHTCGNYKSLPVTDYHNGPPICGNCRKIVPWFFFKCVKCEKHFIKDFRHPKFCPLYPTCWEHTLELDWEYCTEHIGDPNKFEFYRIIIEPIGLNPPPLVA